MINTTTPSIPTYIFNIFISYLVSSLFITGIFPTKLTFFTPTTYIFFKRFYLCPALWNECQTTTIMLEREFRYYLKHQDELVKQYNGRVLVNRIDKIEGHIDAVRRDISYLKGTIDIFKPSSSHAVAQRRSPMSRLIIVIKNPHTSVTD